MSPPELVIEKLVPEGRALARRPDGRVVLVEGCVPGDRITLDSESLAPGMVKARGFRLISPSPLRVAPRCPIASACGGCDWMMLAPEEQARHKLALLGEAMARTGKFRDLRLPTELYRSPSRDGYRSRIRLQTQSDRIGFYARGSHDLVEPAHCTVSAASLNSALAELRELARAHPGALEGVDWLELREAPDATVSVYVRRNERALGAAGRRWLAAVREKYIVATSDAEAEQPSTWQRFQLTAGVFMLSPPGTFTQVNWDVNRALVRRVLEHARERDVRTFFDAFCGAGNFSLPLLGSGSRGTAVESNALAIDAAREAARRQGLSHDTFQIGDAAGLARELGARGQSYDLVLADPPRSGLKMGLAELAGLAAGWFAMCSCNPVTLARDLRALVDLGFEIESIEAFDMFPETHHLETLVFLRAPRDRQRQASGGALGGSPPGA